MSTDDSLDFDEIRGGLTYFFEFEPDERQLRQILAEQPALGPA